MSSAYICLPEVTEFFFSISCFQIVLSRYLKIIYTLFYAYLGDNLCLGKPFLKTKQKNLKKKKKIKNRIDSSDPPPRSIVEVEDFP